MHRCYFAHLGDCDGQLIKAHMIPKQTIKRELYYRAVRGGMSRLEARERAREIADDPRAWRAVCGGPTGIGGHHGQVDAKQISWGEWPDDLMEFLREHDLMWVAEVYA